MSLRTSARKRKQPLTAPQTIAGPDLNKIVAGVENLTNVSQIETLQKKLQSDYKSLAKEFSKSRVSRIDAFLEQIEVIQSSLKKDLEQYEIDLSNTIPTLDEEFAIEVDSIEQIQESKRRKHTVNPDMNLHSPNSPPKPEVPLLKKIPIFEESFEKLLKPFRKELQLLENKFAYDSKIIEDLARRNVLLAWNQCINSRIDLVQSFRKDLNIELSELQKDKFNWNKFERLGIEEERFRKSTLKVADINKSKKIELGQITKKLENCENYSNSNPISGNHPTTATDREILSDINEINASGIKNIRLNKYDSNYLLVDPNRKDEDDSPFAKQFTEEKNVDEEDETEGEQSQDTKYPALLQAAQLQLQQEYDQEYQNSVVVHKSQIRKNRIFPNIPYQEPPTPILPPPLITPIPFDPIAPLASSSSTFPPLRPYDPVKNHLIIPESPAIQPNYK
ncbi:hypothetical protein WICMUC_001908 [Wickerhamomyces mucosus]|uniref:Uncharacterized protein n=1 Tax=Wickerhamomyces mucosus TaxID=1378264 RepID=A0A9P8PRT7_9ASCO|nr:hypothetical protein WICMUC_001908 [Wickerhamomyces mucosus]